MVRFPMADEFDWLALLATWSAWLPFARAVTLAPKTPGVYLARQGMAGGLVYVGKSGERKRMGLRGALLILAQGQAATSGLGEAALDRALADRDWVHDRLVEIDAGRPRRATAWAREAIRRADLYLCWHGTGSEPEATRLERAVLAEVADRQLWNRGRRADRLTAERAGQDHRDQDEFRVDLP
jgi:hypothetical protein